MKVPTGVLTLSLVLILSSVLAGCIGGDDDMEEDPAEFEPVPALESQISMDASPDTWFEPGTQIDVEALAPEDAVGGVNYTWAIQPDPFVVSGNSDAIDTGVLASGESGDLTFDEPGFYEFGHCDPHPWMSHTVAVLNGYDGPDELTVYLYESELEDQDSWGFSPEHITIGTGTTVTYENVGAVEHTASIAHEGEAVPKPIPLGLEEASGTVTLEGFGWMNILVFYEDEAGNGGFAKQQIYVREKFEDYEDTVSDEFMVAHPELEDNQTTEHTFEWSGTATLNVTVEDPTEMLNEIDVTLYEENDTGAREVLIETAATGTAEFTEDFSAEFPRKFVLEVAPVQGLNVAYTIDVLVAYDHTPPELKQLPCPEPHYSLGHC